MSDEISADADLQNNFQRACSRINYCAGLDCSETESLKHTWREQFQSADDKTRKEELVFALLMIKKAKEYWENFSLGKDWTGPVHTFKDQVALEIGRFYSETDDNPKYHISTFFKMLHMFI